MKMKGICMNSVIMKKIISTNGLPDGHYEDPYLDTAIKERVNDKLEYWYNQYSRNGDIHVDSKLTYDLLDGQVTSILLSYTIDNPTTQRLEDFRATCKSFYEVHGFMIDDTGAIPRVFFKATDIFDMATLIHALEYLSISLEGIICPVDASLTEKDAIYSPSGTYLIQLPDVPHYSIKEGTLYISPMAASHCTKLQQLDIPVEMIFDNESLREYPKVLMVKKWDTHYDGTPVEEEDDSDDDMPIFDDHEVGYSKDGKMLMCCRHTFNDIRYEVPDGVEVIDNFAFISCRHFVELSIPRSVKTIGDYLFGNGGEIVIREE